MRDSIIFYRSFYEAIKELPENIQSQVYSAIFEYSLNFNEPQLEGISKTVFTLIKPQLDANNKRFENGKKGGRKTKKEPKDNQNETKSEPNNNANANNNVNYNDNKNEDSKQAIVVGITCLTQQDAYMALCNCASKAFSTEELLIEAQKMADKYNGKPIKNIQALANTWISNKVPTGKSTVSKSVVI